ncbi:UbiH/UbiF/VisC/COQ6 family ubiquinone biosynthesis hydroxylase [Cocleimonas sp. KMM 6892]|uniref:UbiH/UbiF/VisC/COQ6 family ubiquinone biosynthesis hydroxylase n=1 Tax=unclassified Cocleimonas TaxID=2639732 RepID=UPI002DC023D3|nr:MULTISPECIES: UbiH/UbiF/VisC/COQ6 family ubiquinone biosynthesis hydroxylase [unclassified Cocleimonas]MEB8430916.1 UbiH/UbiF/VisC/COQ6 family ubiquinone biosynthesis hydroxylase [Cocleimonas sp. KMM 6892]MEC4714312.1 UbiH/UbiF/VisC/COQ6 family ubiquinone biosynthesis hydroxylase [Cocleimonas sp. KMM 6895]MEC4743643.1 UbiH/UbiF/VisC/COQ6 family ubiquinone biosynthesis hydroxylase [Cocleimonas sp. KMM 6896]
MTDKLSTERKHFDVVINGGGMVGATLACLLAESGRTVAVIEFAKAVEFLADSPYDLRVSAISRASQKAFTEIGAWHAMHEMRASPYESMEVWDAEGNGSVRFDAAELGEPDIGHIIENQVIQKAVSDALKKLDKVTLFQPDSLDCFTVNDGSVEIILQSGGVITANLLVGADGANSSVRELACIDIEFDDYAQSGLVAVVNTELHHQYTAWQRFQKTGPLAFLPLSDGSCSIVWTLPSDRADYFLSLSKNDFKKALAEAFDYKLGNITKVGKRAAFPLRGSQAKPYVMERIALVGDAAHTIHPLAGQGVNLGIKDVVELAKQLDGVADVGKIKALRRYERARRGDNVITMRAMEGFRLLFGHSANSVKSIRNFGMNMFNQLPLVKNEVIRKALGL